MSVSEAIRQSAGWPQATSNSQTFPRPGPRGRQGRPAARPSKPSQGRNGQPGTAGRSRPGRGGPSAAGVRARRGPEPAVIVVALVRTGSVRHREPLVLGGHERSRPAYKNRRSHSIHRYDLGRRSSMGPGSSPSSGTRYYPPADGPAMDGGPPISSCCCPHPRHSRNQPPSGLRRRW
jgi:hypothetical protein